ncbi:MAG: mismatch repair protein [Acidobacteria bacterium]|nr:mismatch repair protein [Acidobacteriota bacterium]
MTPIEEYRQRLAERQSRVAACDRTHVTLGNIRLAIGIAGAFVAYRVFVSGMLTLPWIALPILAFLPLAIYHERLLRKRALAKRAAEFYERGIARLEDRWQGVGETGSRFQDPQHVYADDIDLFGTGSLFQLLSQARTRGGEEMLAGWLASPAARETVRSRQEQVAELREYLDLRETIFVLGEDARDSVNTTHLLEWAEAPPLLRNRNLWMVAGLLTGAVIAAVIAAQWWDQKNLLVAALMAVAAFGFWLRPRVLAVITRIDDAVHDLGLLSSLMAILESHGFRGEASRALQNQLRDTGASEAIRKLHRLAEYIDSRDNVVVRAFGPPLLYGTHLAFAVEHWRARHGTHIRRWLAALSEFEALLSIASYSHEHPTDPFPEIAEEAGIAGVELGHPLLPDSRCVRNSIRLHAGAPLLIVSGSNMSGKSTYLRTIGINVVLAMAGAPVRAQSMRLSPLQIGASIRVTDSLQGGSSRFFAEITRLRKIVDLTAGRTPVLFLLDELLNGTNSHDRALGAEGILRELLQRNGMGLVTTHDLALTAIAQPLGASNIHFQDTLEAGNLRFDYKVRPGVVEKSNALELMRSIGLDV